MSRPWCITNYNSKRLLFQIFNREQLDCPCDTLTSRDLSRCGDHNTGLLESQIKLQWEMSIILYGDADTISVFQIQGRKLMLKRIVRCFNSLFQ